MLSKEEKVSAVHVFIGWFHFVKRMKEKLELLLGQENLYKLYERKFIYSFTVLTPGEFICQSIVVTL